MLEGITRRTVLEIAAAELGLPVLERSVDRSELYMADEVFECGTGAQITPVREVDDRAVGDGVRDTPELMATALTVVVSTRLSSLRHVDVADSARQCVGRMERGGSRCSFRSSFSAWSAALPRPLTLPSGSHPSTLAVRPDASSD